MGGGKRCSRDERTTTHHHHHHHNATLHNSDHSFLPSNPQAHSIGLFDSLITVAQALRVLCRALFLLLLLPFLLRPRRRENFISVICSALGAVLSFFYNIFMQICLFLPLLPTSGSGSSPFPSPSLQPYCTMETTTMFVSFSIPTLSPQHVPLFTRLHLGWK